MSDFAVQNEVKGGKGRLFVAHDDSISELTYTFTSPTLVIADHTQVASGYEGQGIGLILLEQLLSVAEKAGFKIIPLCPFVNAQRSKHPEWADKFAV